MEIPHWAESVLTLIGLIIALYKIHDSNEKKNHERHLENIQKLSTIEGELRPISKWFNKHVIEGNFPKWQ